MMVIPPLQRYLVVGLLAALGLCSALWAQTSPPDAPAPLPAIDVSRDRLSTAIAAEALVGNTQRQALQALQAQVPGLAVEWNALTGTPASLRSTRALLSEPSTLAPAQVLRRFVADNSVLFGLTSADIDTLQQVRNVEAPGAGIDPLRSSALTHIALDQRWQGRQVHPATLLASVTNRGQLVSVAGDAVRDVGGKVDTDAPALSAVDAIAAAAANLGIEDFDAAALSARDEASGPERYQLFAGESGFAGDVPVRLIYFLASRDDVRLVWEVTAGARASPYLYQVFVDAASGDILFRRNLTDADVPRWRVYFDVLGTPASDPRSDMRPLDNPAPLSPGPVPPDGTQGSPVPSVLLSSNGAPSSSGGGWIGAGVNTTSGNNVVAFVDRNGNGSPDAGEQPIASIVEVEGTATRSFDFAADLAQPPESAGNESAATVQTFVMANWWHDRMAALGFTAAAGNFQRDNGAEGGRGGDPILARLHVGTNNSTFGTPASDGICCPVLNAYTWTGPDPDRDSGLDNGILIHEFTHGLSNRIIGGPNVRGLSSEQGRGLGEGYSDLYASLLLRTPDEDPDGAYAVGEYSTFMLPPGFGQPPDWDDNYTFGIRHFPYTTDLCANPFTLIDMVPSRYDITPVASAACEGDPPVSPWLATRAGAVHDTGEIWAANVWEVRRNLVAAHGADLGNELMLQLLTDSLFLLAQDPTFVEARDAIVLADLARTGGANECDIWRGFAKRGMGPGAATPESGTFVEDFDVPPQCETEREERRFRYAAKLVCGVVEEPDGSSPARGRYATSVNIHNPGPERAEFDKTLALTLPPKEQTPGEVHPVATDVLDDGLALASDCADIRRRVFGGAWPGGFADGFLLIDSPVSLDVVAVYTSGALEPERAGVGIDVEAVAERVIGSPPGTADLLPVPDARGGFCRRSPDGLTVTVSNRGTAGATASTLLVDFGASGAVSSPVPALGTGATAELTVAIPPGCFGPDCDFLLSADSTDVVDESDEDNNTASGTCLG